MSNCLVCGCLMVPSNPECGCHVALLCVGPDSLAGQEILTLRTALDGVRGELEAAKQKLADGATFCSGEWPCEASMFAAEFERDKHTAEEERDAALADALRLREALYDYGKHTNDCMQARDEALMRNNPATPLPCICGFKALMESPPATSLAAHDRALVERCAKAQCQGCKDDVPRTRRDFVISDGHGRWVHIHPWGDEPCHAAAIRALLPEGERGEEGQ